jgi:hypothetical protein
VIRPRRVSGPRLLRELEMLRAFRPLGRSRMGRRLFREMRPYLTLELTLVETSMAMRGPTRVQGPRGVQGP